MKLLLTGGHIEATPALTMPIIPQPLRADAYANMGDVLEVMVMVRVRVRVRGDYVLRLHTPFSIVGVKSQPHSLG